jgi:group I intron endonuclease
MGRPKDTELAKKKEHLKNFGEIYVIRNKVNGKLYVGQAVLLYAKRLQRYGSHGRWRGHVLDAKNGKGTCRYLNHAIQKYGEENFEVTPILCCKIEDLTRYEDMFIQELNSMAPHGYNLKSAGRCGRPSDETLRRMSESMRGAKHPQYGKPHRAETKQKISQTNIDKMIRYDYDGITELPKYLKYVKWSDQEGYHILSHPLCKKKVFVYVLAAAKAQRSLSECKKEAMKLLDALNNKLEEH